MEEREQIPIAVDAEMPSGEVRPSKQRQEIYRILRDTNLARQIKQLHRFKCQICGEFIPLPSGDRYAEAHHIKPLGQPHNGPDIAENIIVLCPNHHVMLDYGVIQMSLTEIRDHPKHRIDSEYVDYHNKIILNST